jgi:hypothetical protein
MSSGTKWVLIGVGCFLLLVVGAIFAVFGLCVAGGVVASKAIKEAIVEDGRQHVRLFLSAAEAGEWDQAREQFDARLKNELSVDKLKARVEKDPDSYRISDLQLERDESVQEPGRLGLKGTLRSRSGATLHARFVLVRTGKGRSGSIDPGGEEVRGQDGDETGLDPDFEWKIDELEISPDAPK